MERQLLLLRAFIFTTAISFLVGGCSRESSPAERSAANTAIASCGPQTLAAYSKLQNKEHRIEEIYQLMGKRTSDTVTMLELKQAARQLGFQADGYLLDPDNLEDVETYAIIPVGENKTGSQSDPFHFVLVRFTKGKIFEISYDTLEQKPVETAKLRKIWKGPALFLREHSSVQR